MMNNREAYGPNDPPNDMVAPLNSSQVAAAHSLGHNLNNFGKMGQQAPSTASAQYNLHNYPYFGQPTMTGPSQINPYQSYQNMGYSSQFLSENSQFLRQSSIHNTFQHVSNPIQDIHHNNMMNYHQNIDQRIPEWVPHENYKEHSVIKNFPINIPQVPTRTSQRTIESNFDTSNSGNSFRITTNDSQYSIRSKSDKPLLSDTKRKSLEKTVRLIENILIQSTNNNTRQDISGQNPIDADPLALNVQHDNPANEDTCDSKNTEGPRSDISEPDDELTKIPANVSEPEDEQLTNVIKSPTNISETKDEPTKLIKTTNVSELEERPTKVTKKATKISQLEDELTRVTKTLKKIKKINRKAAKRAKKAAKLSKAIEESQPNVNETREIADLEFVEVSVPRAEPVKVEDQESDVKIKVEHSSWVDLDFMNPFLRDCNGTTSVELEDMKTIEMENSLEEATETIKNGSKSSSYYQCPHCSLYILHPKRFLIHTKWHTFGLTNERRAELAKERENRRNERRVARTMERLNATEVTGEEGGGKTFPCKDCDKVFTVKSSLKNHRARFHPTNISQCHICLTPVKGWLALRAHLKIHTDKDNNGFYHQCPHCPKRFKFRHSLTKHADTHLEKTHACPVCSKMFGSEKLVQQHMKTHERAARGATYHCSYCAKGFYEQYNLNVHERTHTNERPYVCDICNSQFLTNSSLKRHLKVSHSESNPHVCKVCQRSFSSANIRDRHELRAHADPHAFPYPCSMCQKRYMKPKDLRSHVYKAHPTAKKKAAASETDSN